MLHIFLRGLSLCLGNHCHRDSVKVRQPTDDRRIVLIITVPMQLHKIRKQMGNVVAAHWAFLLPGDLHALPRIADFSVCRIFRPFVFPGMRISGGNSRSVFLIFHHFLGRAGVHFQDLAQHRLLLFPIYDPVNKAMLQKKFRPLEALRKLLPDGLLNDTGARKPDQRIGLRQDDVAQHGKAGRHTSCGGIGQHGDIELSRVAVPLQCGRGLGHLHQGYNALLHPGAAGAGKQNHRKFLPGGALHGPGDLFSHGLPHAGHQKSPVADADHRRLSLNLCPAGHYCLF